MNVELLKKVKDHILEEPRRLDMLYGIRTSATAPCGTIGCIAGWAAILSGRISPKEYEDNEVPWWGHIPVIAEEELGLSAYQGEKVFYSSGWPQPFRGQYFEATDAQSRATVTAARIQHLIDTGE